MVSVSLTLDVHIHAESEGKVGAAQPAREAIEKAVTSVSLTAQKQEGLSTEESESLVAG
jgi:hypothetical protein